VYADFGHDANSNITLVAAVRDPKKACVDESAGCSFERATLCAFDTVGAGGMDSKVSFLECMDETPATKALANAASCAAKVSPPINDTAIAACYGSSRGEALLVEQSALWNKAYPKPSGIPAVNVNGVHTAETTVGGASREQQPQGGARPAAHARYELPTDTRPCPPTNPRSTCSSVRLHQGGHVCGGRHCPRVHLVCACRRQGRLRERGAAIDRDE